VETKYANYTTSGCTSPLAVLLSNIQYVPASVATKAP